MIYGNGLEINGYGEWNTLEIYGNGFQQWINMENGIQSLIDIECLLVVNNARVLSLCEYFGFRFRQIEIVIG